MKNYLDLTHRIRESMPVFPGDPQPEVREIMSLGEDFCAVQSIRFNNHIGTHLDAPSHFIEDGMTVDQIPLETLIGDAIVLDFTDKGKDDLITKMDLRLHQHQINTGSRVLIKTGWDRNFTSPAYYEHFPCLTLESAEYLASRRIKLLGVDTPSPSPLDDPDQAIHKTLLGAGVVLVENIKDLTQIGRDECQLIVLPLPIEDFSGAPCRVVVGIE